MRKYELVFIVQPELEEEAVNAFVENVQQIMRDNGGEVETAEQLGIRRLAYPIKKHEQGYYALIQAGLEQTAIQEVERALKLSEDVLRYLMVRLEEVQA